MREELKDTEVVEVNGGAVILSQPLNLCCFNKIKKKFKILGPFKDMRDMAFDFYDQYGETMSGEEFDTFVMEQFQQRGWI